LFLERWEKTNHAWKRWLWISVLDPIKRRVRRGKSYEDCSKELSRSLSRGYDAEEIFSPECAEDL